MLLVNDTEDTKFLLSYHTEENRVEVESIQMDLSSLQKDNLYQIILATLILNLFQNGFRAFIQENREES